MSKSLIAATAFLTLATSAAHAGSTADRRVPAPSSTAPERARIVAPDIGTFRELGERPTLAREIATSNRSARVLSSDSSASGDVVVPAPSELQRFGDATSYSGRTSFEAACGDLRTLDMSGSLLEPGTVAACWPIHTWELGSAACYDPMTPTASHPGLELRTRGSITGGLPTNGLVVLTEGFLDAPTTVHGANAFADALQLDFSCRTTCVGFDIHALVRGPGEVRLDVYGPDDAELLASVIVLAEPAGTFFGMRAPSGIGRIVMDDAEFDVGALITNLSFNGCPVDDLTPPDLELPGRGGFEPRPGDIRPSGPRP
ncbi:MAG: hypothetical protein AAF533_11910 [Acidobacteriota bacterium]